jgi:hypothetical protein
MPSPHVLIRLCVCVYVYVSICKKVFRLTVLESGTLVGVLLAAADRRIMHNFDDDWLPLEGGINKGRGKRAP